jgi:uncharacterized membrane protein
MRRELLPVSIIVLMFAIALYAGPLVLQNWRGEVPLQWGADGEVTGWGSTINALYILPALTAIFYLAFMILPHLGIYKKEVEHFAAQFHGFKVIFVFVMGVIYIATLIPALGIWGSFEPLYIIVPAIALIFFYVGHMLSFTHSQREAAGSLPASERVWKNTNRFGSNLFWFCGALILVSLVAPADSRLWFLLLPLIFCAFAVFAYSLYEYKKAGRSHAKANSAAVKSKKRR